MDLEKALQITIRVKNTVAQVIRFVVVCLFPLWWCYYIAVLLRTFEYYLTGK